MTNTLNKIMHDGDEYLFPEGFSPDNTGTTDDVLTKTASGYEWSALTASNTVIVSPAPSNINDYATNSVYCSAQGSGTLTFSCNTEPSVDIDVNVLIIN